MFLVLRLLQRGHARWPGLVYIFISVRENHTDVLNTAETELWVFGLHSSVHIALTSFHYRSVNDHAVAFKFVLAISSSHLYFTSCFILSLVRIYINSNLIGSRKNFQLNNDLLNYR